MNELILEDTSLIQKYDISTYWSETDKAYIAEMPELPGCISDGASEGEARHSILLIAQEWLDTARLLGRPVPGPSREQAFA